MTVQIEIRPLAGPDKPLWSELWRDYLAFYEATRPDEIYDLTFARYTDPKRDDMHAWLAWQGDKAVGLVHAIVHAHGWSAEPVTYLQDLYATPETRGTGVGRKLIETVYADADAAGRPSVYWLTQDHNTTARVLYDRVATLTPFIKYARA